MGSILQRGLAGPAEGLPRGGCSGPACTARPVARIMPSACGPEEGQEHKIPYDQGDHTTMTIYTYLPSLKEKPDLPWECTLSLG